MTKIAHQLPQYDELYCVGQSELGRYPFCPSAIEAMDVPRLALPPEPPLFVHLGMFELNVYIAGVLVYQSET
jgi:hypothetical protein